MATVSVTLPDSLAAFLEAEAADRGFGSSDEFLRDLVRREHDRARVRNLLLEGLASPLEGPADKEFFDGLRDRIGRRGAN
ncbi:MAG: type II toxin-antitoxin system ParD family antitoxin [Allosphingosinicella sp.]|uniref:ribbon-helix-helix domain-containing protein n=1 Tax=Allosphingosinicella sp. TaxID=2823234 RepID=UPI0039226442